MAIAIIPLTFISNYITIHNMAQYTYTQKKYINKTKIDETKNKTKNL